MLYTTFYYIPNLGTGNNSNENKFATAKKSQKLVAGSTPSTLFPPEGFVKLSESKLDPYFWVESTNQCYEHPMVNISQSF